MTAAKVRTPASTRSSDRRRTHGGSRRTWEQLTLERSSSRLFVWLAPSETGSCASLTYELELTTACKFGQIPNCSSRRAPRSAKPASPKPSGRPKRRSRSGCWSRRWAATSWRVRVFETEKHAARTGPPCAVHLNVGRLVDDVNGDGYSELGAGRRGRYERNPSGLFFVGRPTTQLTEASALPKLGRDSTPGVSSATSTATAFRTCSSGTRARPPRCRACCSARAAWAHSAWRRCPSLSRSRTPARWRVISTRTVLRSS